MKNKTYLVVGAGKSGICSCALLNEQNAGFILYDGNKDLDTSGLRDKYDFLNHDEIFCGDFPDPLYERCDICVLSPGVPTDLPFIQKLKDKGIEIWGEIELAFRFGKGRVCAITGTNGKTTTTSLVGEILAKAFPDTRVVGNIGIPYTSVAASTTEETVVVAEISSFQLETAITFKPYASAILNITPDHLDRHHTMENYILAKESIAKNQEPESVCVLNYDDEVLRSFGEKAPCRVVWFSSKEALPLGVYYRDGAIYLAEDGKTEKVIDTAELNILGVHNYENVAAAVALCRAFGTDMEIIRDGLRRFVAVPHRIEFICEKNGVAFYNDSKGTNPDAAIKAVEAMERPTHLIGGGYDKDASYDAWIESFGDTVKSLCLIGKTKEKIAACCEKHGFREVRFADSLEEAVKICYQAAGPGEAVLLSPACASWDMFKSYEQRGELFAEYAKTLE